MKSNLGHCQFNYLTSPWKLGSRSAKYLFIIDKAYNISMAIQIENKKYPTFSSIFCHEVQSGVI